MDNHEDTLADVLRSLWKARVWLLGGALLALILSIIFLVTVTPRFMATMIIAPADGYALGDYASAQPYDRMLSLPFWRPMDPEGISTDYYRFIHTLRGPMVADVLLKDESVLRGIRSDKRWLTHAENWTAEELGLYLDKSIEIEPLGATPLRRITYTHPDGVFAAALLRKIHLVSDQMIRRDRRRQSQNRVEYLEQALSQTTNPDHRKVMTNLLMQQEHIRMLANMDEPYAAIVVEPAFSGPRRHWPKPFVVVSVALFVGLFLGYMMWSFRQHNDTT